MTEEFIIARHGADTGSFELHVSETKKEMHEHIAKYFDDFGGESGCTNDTLGLVHPVQSYEISEDGTETWLGNFAVVFLNLERLDNEIVAHEAVHAALSYERFINKNEQASFGDACGPIEERLAYLVGEITFGIFGTLKEFGLLPKE